MYPFKSTINIGEKSGDINFYSGLTTFIGPNGSGKTRVMRQLKLNLKNKFNEKVVRYLSSNRIGTLEQFRSRTLYYKQTNQNVSLGGIDYKNARHDLEVATGDFFTLDERKDVYIKVSERLSTLLDRNVFLEWENGNLTVSFQKTKSLEVYSIAAESSGLLNLISILAALYDDEVSILLIDEPEVSLHPQMQAFLLNEIKKVSGDFNEKGKKMIIMGTHSIDMINIKNIDNLSNYVFFSENDKFPVQVNPDLEELKNRKLGDLVSRLGQMHKTAFFSERPLLVEGISDTLICNYFDDRFEFNLGIAGTQIVPVDGKGQFPATVKLMRMIGKNPIIIADLDAFVDNNDVVNIFINDEEAKNKALINGHADTSSFIRNVKNDFFDICGKNGEDIKEIYEKHPYWINRDKSNDENQYKRRAIMAVLMENKDISNWKNHQIWYSIKLRIASLLDCLEESGCFILRKGSVESYYIHSNKDTSAGKTSAALDEIEKLQSLDKELIEENYNDILRALKYSAKRNSVDESNSIKREILGELAPILNILDKETDISDINLTIRQVRGKSKSLFEYEPILIENKPALNIKLKSNIIDVKGFPMTIKKDDNINRIIDESIK